ncbi:MAG TPA: hypothetical protein ENH82_16295 [bacterium]|nr:hypothetical protein [bacterium]
MLLLFGFVLILIAGFLQGTFFLPMTFTRKWEWEHTWFTFSLTGMFIFNWIFIFATVPEIFTIFKTAPSRDILIIIIFGSLWGIGAILTGLAMDKLGMALAYPIVIGLVSSLGALIPLIVFFPATLFTVKGLVLIIGTAGTIVGVIMCSRAFSRKETSTDFAANTRTGSLAVKLAIAISAGVMSALMNVGFAYGVSLVETARTLGISETFAINVAWAIILTCGGIVNLLYCLYLMIKRNTLKDFIGPETARNLGLGSLMGIIWCGGLYIYGMGVSSLGGWGVVVGWVLFMSVNIIVGNLWGIWRGEWKEASQSARALLNRGLIVIIIAIIIVAVSNSL